MTQTVTQHRIKSQAVYERACNVLPGGVSSPARAWLAVRIAPLIAKRGKGDTVWDEDEQAYIDFCGSFGALILGHAPKRVMQCVAEQLDLGCAFATTTANEVLLAEKILAHFPSCEKIRFVVTGTEATMSAIRLARHVTGRSLIVKFDGQYHGHSDSLLVAAGSSAASLPASKGVLKAHVQHTISLPFNDIETCRTALRMQKDLAAVIVEPVSANMGVIPARREFLEMLREETEKKKALLIFDEVVTGYRASLGGVTQFFGIVPDLTCLGKIIGGGFPIAAFGGKGEIMDQLAPLGNVYQAGTFAAHPIAVVAGIETLRLLEEMAAYPKLIAATEWLLAPLRDIVDQRNLPIAIHSFGTMFSLYFGVRSVQGWKDVERINKEQFRAFFAYLFERGVYLSPGPFEAQFLSFAHTQEHLEKVQEAMKEFLLLL